MTVGELIEELRKYDPQKRVLIDELSLGEFCDVRSIQDGVPEDNTIWILVQARED